MATASKHREALLASLPPDAQRIQVVDEMGKTKYRKIAEIAENDTIVIGDGGQPIVMTAPVGRPSKVELLPPNPQVAELRKQKKVYLEEDELLQTIKKHPEKSAVLDYVMGGLAEEAASLGFERNEAERNGEATSQISMRRINALKAVGDSWLKRKEQISNSGVDMDSPAFKKLFGFILETVRETMGESHLRPEMVDTVFANLAKKLNDEWTKNALKRMTEG